MQTAASEPKMSGIKMFQGDKRLQTQVLKIADNTVCIRSLDWDRDRFDIEFACAPGSRHPHASSCMCSWGRHRCRIEFAHSPGSLSTHACAAGSLRTQVHCCVPCCVLVSRVGGFSVHKAHESHFVVSRVDCGFLGLCEALFSPVVCACSALCARGAAMGMACRQETGAMRRNMHGLCARDGRHAQQQHVWPAG
jgi:hypothetical protein